MFQLSSHVTTESLCPSLPPPLPPSSQRHGHWLTKEVIKKGRERKREGREGGREDISLTLSRHKRETDPTIKNIYIHI